MTEHEILLTRWPGRYHGAHRRGRERAAGTSRRPEFLVHRHIRGKWACKYCQRLVHEPVEPQIIDEGAPTAAFAARFSAAVRPAAL